MQKTPSFSSDRTETYKTTETVAEMKFNEHRNSDCVLYEIHRNIAVSIHMMLFFSLRTGTYREKGVARAETDAIYIKCNNHNCFFRVAFTLKSEEKCSLPLVGRERK